MVLRVDVEATTKNWLLIVFIYVYLFIYLFWWVGMFHLATPSVYIPKTYDRY